MVPLGAAPLKAVNIQGPRLPVNCRTAWQLFTLFRLVLAVVSRLLVLRCKKLPKRTTVMLPFSSLTVLVNILLCRLMPLTPKRPIGLSRTRRPGSLTLLSMAWVWWVLHMTRPIIGLTVTAMLHRLV